MVKRSAVRIVILALFFLASVASFAQTDNWLGGSALWSTSSKWSSGLPGPTSDVVIATVGDAVFLDVTTTINSLTIGQISTLVPPTYLVDISTPQTLNVTGSAMIETSGILRFHAGTLNASSLTIHGAVAMAGSSILNVTGTVINSGPFSEFDVGLGGANVGGLTSSSGFVEVDGTLNLTSQPAGITDIPSGLSFSLFGALNAGPNNGFYQLTSVEGNLILANGQTTTSTPIGGTFTVGSTGYVEVVTGTAFNINGNVVINPGGVFSVNDPLPTTVNISGMLTNNGGHVNVVGPNAFLNVGGIGNGGTLTLPEGSTVNLANGFYQLAQGTLGETIGAMGFSILAVNGGLVMLNGTLDVMLDSGFNPPVGTTYDFLTFNPGLLSGTFSSVVSHSFNNGTEYFVLSYNNAGGYVSLTAEPVPEPSSFLLLGTGLLGAIGVIRRKINL